MTPTVYTRSRIDLLSEEAAAKAAAEVELPAAFAGLNVFRLLLHSPKVAKAVGDLLLAQLFGPNFNSRQRELIIMRTGWVTGCDYEWTQHWRVARETFGVSEEELLALRDWRSADCFSPSDRAVLSAVDDSLESGVISAGSWAAIQEHVTEAADQLELVTAICTWRLISQLARSLEIPLEEGIPSWPPDGAEGGG
jgi:alkylhydroperoxidase family enzyme